MSKPVVPVDSLGTILASNKSSREAAAQQAAISQRENERRQAAYREFTAAFDALYDFGDELVGRTKREVVIETTRTDWLSWEKLWRRAAENLTDKMKGALRDALLAKLPSLLKIAVHVLLSQSTVSDEELADLLRVLIEDPGTRDFVECLPWLRDRLHPPIEIFSERHGCNRVPKPAGFPFWLSPDEYVNPEYAAFFGHGGTTDVAKDSMQADTRPSNNDAGDRRAEADGDSSTASSVDTPQISEDALWITGAEAERQTLVARGTIKRAADDEKIVTNGKEGRDKRYHVASVHAWNKTRVPDG